MNLPIIQLPVLVSEYGPYFESLFTAGEYGQFQRYLSGLLTSDNKTVEGINRLFIQPSQCQSSLNRFLTESSYDIQEVNQRRVAWLQECPATGFKKGPPARRGVLVIDDTLLEHVGKHFEHIARLYGHSKERYVQAHNLVTLHYSDDGVDYPLYFQLWKPPQVDLLEQALEASGVRIRPKERLLKGTAPSKWRAHLVRLANKNQDKEAVRQVFRSKLSIAQELLLALCHAYPDTDMPVVFDSWYTAPWFCRWLGRELGKAYVGTLKPDEEVFREANQFCRLDDFAEQLKAQHLAKPQERVFVPTTIYYKGKQETYYAYTHMHSIRSFGRHRLVINYRKADLSDKPAFFICNRPKWDAGAITRIRRHRWPVEVYHEEGKAEGLDKYQVRGFEAIHKHIAFTALAYSMLQRARFDASLVAKLQGELDHEIQGSLAFWRRAMQAHALMAILAWVSQAVIQGDSYAPLWGAMVKAIAYPG